MVQPFHLLAKPVGAICNLDCTYCYYLIKEDLYPGSSFRMSESLLETYLKQLLEAQPSNEVYINWQGGEPTLMGLDFFKRVVELVERYKKPTQTIVHTIQTNGTNLDDSWAQFFQQNYFLVGLSLDGPESIHNHYRVDKQGKGTFHRVMRGLTKLKEHNIDFNILCTVNAYNVNYPIEVYTFFRDVVETPFLQFIPVIEKTAPLVLEADSTVSPLVTSQSVPARMYGEFLSTVFNIWVHYDVGKLFVQDFEVALTNWMKLQPSLCVHSETCGLALALEHTGDLYCCDHFVDVEHRLGNIQTSSLTEMIASAKQTAFGNNKRDSLPQYCKECDFKFACHGGCPKDRILDTPTGEAGLNYLCEGYKIFFAHIASDMTYMANLMRLGYPATEIMNQSSKAESYK